MLATSPFSSSPALCAPLSASKRSPRPGNSPHGEGSWTQDPPRASYIPNIPEPAKVSARGSASAMVSKLDARAWLEVLDPSHRYAKHLRWYYQAWDLLGKPRGDFFTWLDTSDYELEHCPRALLLRDTVHYCSSDEVSQYALAFVDARDGDTSAKGADTPLGVENVEGAEAGAEVHGSIVDAESAASAVAVSLNLSEECTNIEEGSAVAPSSCSSTVAAGVQLVWAASKAVVVTPPQGLIFVLRDGTLYAAEKTTQAPRFHHSSFFAGESVEVAGMLVSDSSGNIKKVFPHSGHYRPGDKHIQYLLRFLENKGVDLAGLEVDGQHTMKVARLLAKEGTRLKKKERPHFLNGQTILSFLEMKAWSTPLFEELVAKQRDARHGSGRSSRSSSERKSMGPFEGALRSSRSAREHVTAEEADACRGDSAEEDMEEVVAVTAECFRRGGGSLHLTGLEEEFGLLPLAACLSESPITDSRDVQGLDLSGHGSTPRRRTSSGTVIPGNNELSSSYQGPEAGGTWESTWKPPLPEEPTGPPPGLYSLDLE